MSDIDDLLVGVEMVLRDITIGYDPAEVQRVLGQVRTYRALRAAPCGRSGRCVRDAHEAQCPISKQLKQTILNGLDHASALPGVALPKEWRGDVADLIQREMRDLK